MDNVFYCDKIVFSLSPRPQVNPARCV